MCPKLKEKWKKEELIKIGEHRVANGQLVTGQVGNWKGTCRQGEQKKYFPDINVGLCTIAHQSRSEKVVCGIFLTKQ